MTELNGDIILDMVKAEGGYIRFLDLESKLRKQDVSFDRKNLAQLVSRFSRFGGGNFKLVFTGIFFHSDGAMDASFSLPMSEIQKLPPKRS